MAFYYCGDLYVYLLNDENNKIIAFESVIFFINIFEVAILVIQFLKIVIVIFFSCQLKLHLSMFYVLYYRRDLTSFFFPTKCNILLL